MKICYFGSYNTDAARNQIIMDGLRAHGSEVMECQNDAPGVRKIGKLFVHFYRNCRSADALIVGYPGHMSAVFAKLITRKPVIFDAFFSLYDSAVHDRKQVSRWSFAALRLWIVDWLSCRVADVVLLDTNEHIAYFVEEFGIRKEKFRRVLIGAHEDFFYPKPHALRLTDSCTVLFQGSFIPLQGVEYIIEAAYILKNEPVQFLLRGEGQTKVAAEKQVRERGLTNVTFLGRAPYEAMNDDFPRAHIALGIFGATPKAKRVVPNKVYEALAARMPVITGGSPALEEVFEDGVHLMAVPMQDAEGIAEAIRTLARDTVLRTSIAQRGYQRYLEVGTTQKVGATVKKVLEEVLRDRKRG